MLSVNANRGYSWFSSAVRFGRIPKREKQRLLDEMQSYMNSLNESASMEMEVSPPPDAPCSPQNHQSNEGVSSISQSYRSNLISTEEKPLKMAASNLGTQSFQNNSVHEPAQLHTATQTQHTLHGEQANLTPSYHCASNCPVAPTNNESSNNTNVDNSKYNFSNQNQCPVTGHLSSQSYTANHNSFQASDSQNQNSCPWKLNGGAKVLVSIFFFQYVNIICLMSIKST